MKDREEFFFILSVVLGFTLFVCFFALVGCCSTSSVEVVKEVVCG